MIVYANTAIPGTKVSCPTQSSSVGSGSLDSSTPISVSTNTTAPSGTLTANTLRQPRVSTISPPSAGADAAPTIPMAIQSAMARAFMR
ncbi:hypothetical protein NJB1728e18_11760 [Mycobacterium marinum]|nr:hypothetical protein NJB1728e18_11760 [Mycobacterium marinum]